MLVDNRPNSSSCLRPTNTTKGMAALFSGEGSVVESDSAARGLARPTHECSAAVSRAMEGREELSGHTDTNDKVIFSIGKRNLTRSPLPY